MAIIDPRKATEKQILKIKVGLLKYEYIQRHYIEGDTEDFRDVFHDFYMRSKPSMEEPGNRDPFFKMLFDCPPDKDLIDLMEELQTETEIKDYLFSFSTKLLHTVNTASPIYDSKVYKYLKNEEKVNLRDPQYQRKEKGTGRILTKPEKLAYNWRELNRWYDAFMKTQRAREWVAWFDQTFPNDREISDVKKIDFIIYACGEGRDFE